MVDDEVSHADLEGRGEVHEIIVVVDEGGPDLDVLDPEGLLRARVAAVLHPVLPALAPISCAVVVKEVRYHRLSGAVHRTIEIGAEVVAVVVRHEFEVEARGELGRAAVHEVDGEERLLRLHHIAHVVHAPHGRRAFDLRLGDSAQHLLERLL